MPDKSVELDKKGMRITLPCGCKIILKAEDDADMIASIPKGAIFMCKHGYRLTFTGTNQWVFHTPCGSIFSTN